MPEDDPKYELVHGGTFYDLLTVLCWRIEQLDDDAKEKLYKQAANCWEDRIEDVKTRFPFLRADEARPTLCAELTEEILVTLEEALKCEPVDWVLILCVAVAVDDLMEWPANSRSFTRPHPVFDVSDSDFARNELKAVDVSDYIEMLVSLNPRTRSEFGDIIPRLPCDWEKGGFRSSESLQRDPLSFLRHYLWVPPGSKWEAEHLLVTLCDKEPLKLIMSPLSSQAPFKAGTKPGEDNFYVRYSETKANEITERVKRTIDAARAENAHILLFPEMMASPSCIAQSAAYLQEGYGNRRPGLVFLPTSEYERDGKWVNQLLVLDSDGNCVFGYNKQWAFELDASKGNRRALRYEPIEADNKFYVLHVPHVGRIGMMICADTFESGYLKYALERYKLTLLLHIVFSQGEDRLLRSLSDTEKGMCDVVLCNTCAVLGGKTSPAERAPLVAAYLANGHMGCIRKEFRGCGAPDSCRGCTLTVELPTSYGTAIPELQYKTL
ncbi:hypothetical protein [Vermiculatibacterium agrestimuris]|uniref:hypothetical protein n=1 Tax=Vermiculatibacterium agrestimuris TaxID=2941519 RepID=UPI00203A8AD6|nr:hypothetical protein [Vermiculatibacterium agrestimuris]